MLIVNMSYYLDQNNFGLFFFIWILRNITQVCTISATNHTIPSLLFCDGYYYYTYFDWTDRVKMGEADRLLN